MCNGTDLAMAGLHVSDIGVPVGQPEQALSTRPAGVLHADHSSATRLACWCVCPLRSSVGGVTHPRWRQRRRQLLLLLLRPHGCLLSLGA